MTDCGRSHFAKLVVTIVLTVVAWGLFENPANGQQITGQVSMEGRLFTQDALRDNLYPTNVSIAIEPEFYQELNDGRQSLTVVPFLRWDEHDSEPLGKHR